MAIQQWEHFFKPEVRSSGQALLAEGKVSIAQPSDTEVVVYVRTSSPPRVSLKTKSVSSDTVIVDCTCPVGKKNQFCKHVWAGLLATEQKSPDFFESKTEIEKREGSLAEKQIPKSKTTEQSQAWAEKQTAFKEKQKEKQKAYRQEQYQKQKQRMKELKNKSPEEESFPIEVEKALGFFSENGFELRDGLSKELISAARKKLSRVFHPDFGGSHEESVELNKNADVLMRFTKK